MRKPFKLFLTALCLTAFAIGSTARDGDTNPILDKYFTRATAVPAAPDKDGFITRWTILEPIAKQASSNSVWIDSYMRESAATDYFKDQMTILPYDGEKTMVGKEKLYWHALDSKKFFVNLLRFAEAYDKPYYGQVYFVETTIICEEDIQDVRLAAGVNSAAMWYLNGEEVLMMSNDRDLVADDMMSRKLTLHKGENIVRGMVFNGPGMADFCLRFVDSKGKPVKNITVSAPLSKKKK